MVAGGKALGWRFRKVFGSGPFRWTMSKKGIGWSIGIPGLRYGESPTGQKYVSFGIPGTGLYFIKYLHKQRPAQLPTPTPTATQPAPPPQQQTSSTVTSHTPWWKEWKP